jgi:multidrug efflux system outer membrane protein
MTPSRKRPGAQRAFPIRRVIAGAAALLMAGCSLQPVYQRPELPVAPQFPVGPAYDQAGGSPDQRTAVEIGWREFLGDPRLQRLVEIALANNRDLRVAALNVEQVRAQYRIQRAALLPQVGVAADGSSSRTPASVSASRAPVVQHAYSVEATIAWEIDFFGRLRSRTTPRCSSTSPARRRARRSRSCSCRRWPTSTFRCWHSTTSSASPISRCRPRRRRTT